MNSEWARPGCSQTTQHRDCLMDLAGKRRVHSFLSAAPVCFDSEKKHLRSCSVWWTAGKLALYPLAISVLGYTWRIWDNYKLNQSNSTGRAGPHRGPGGGRLKIALRSARRPCCCGRWLCEKHWREGNLGHPRSNSLNRSKVLEVGRLHSWRRKGFVRNCQLIEWGAAGTRRFHRHGRRSILDTSSEGENCGWEAGSGHWNLRWYPKLQM